MRDINDLKNDKTRAEAKLAKAEQHLVLTQERIEKRRLSIQRLDAAIEKAGQKPAPAEKKLPGKPAPTPTTAVKAAPAAKVVKPAKVAIKKSAK
jgi:multidrug resistance efflux pump